MFRRLLIITFCLVIFVKYTLATSTIILKTTTVIDNSNSNVSPGDTLFLESGIRSFLLIKNYHGTEQNPIVIINQTNQVEINTTHFYGIKFDLCSHIKLSGKGNAGIQYGIYISEVTHEYGTGISVDNLSTDIEIEYVEISNIPIGGIYVKTEPRCDLASTRENFTLYNFVMHDCYLHDIGDEGMYIGS